MSVGLFVLAAFHAVAFVAVSEMVNVGREYQVERVKDKEWNLGLPKTAPIAEPYRSAPSVNVEAQREIKGQCGPGGCTVNPYSNSGAYLRPLPGVRIVPNVANRSPGVGDRDFDGAVINYVGPPRSPSVANSNPRTPVRPDVNPDLVMPLDSDLPPKKMVQVALFLDDSSMSRQVEGWFNSDRDLVSLRRDADYQVYRAGSPVFEARYKNIVNRQDLPVVVVQDSDGGHIHVARRSNMPSSSGGLVEDIDLGARYRKQIKNSNMPITGLLRSVSDSYAETSQGRKWDWDEDVVPELQSQDCVGPDCPVDFNPTDRPRPLDRLFNRDRDTAQAFVWVNAIEIATGLVFLVVGIMVIMVVRKFTR